MSKEMSKEMNRRLFLKLIPVAAASSATIAPALNSEVLKPKSRKPPPAWSTEKEYLEEYLAKVNEIVDLVNGRMVNMSEDEMRVRASLSLAEYLKRYG